MRYKTHKITVGKECIGGTSRVLVQSMATVATVDIDAVVEQILRVYKFGASLVRLTVQGVKEAEALPHIKQRLLDMGYEIPISADIHFSYKISYLAAEVVEKVRINPGNFVKHRESDDFEEGIDRIKVRFLPLLDICRRRKVALRIGVNHGSLSERIVQRYGDTPQGIVASCLEYLDICEKEDFKDVVVSIKSSNTVVMIRAVRLLVEEMQKRRMSYPLHLGVTEAGEGEDARLKSSVGIGTLLNQNIGDTIRVSLTEPPEQEPSVARKIIAYTGRDKQQDELKLFPQHREIKIYKSFNKNTVAQVVLDARGSSIPDLESIGYSKNGKKKMERAFDYLVVDTFDSSLPEDLKQIIPVKNYIGKGIALYPIEKWNTLCKEDDRLSFVECKEGQEELLCNLNRLGEKQVVLIYEVQASATAFERIWKLFLLLDKESLNIPVVVSYSSNHKDYEDFQIASSSTLGGCFVDRMVSGVLLRNPHHSVVQLKDTAFGILQATRVRTTKAEFISCPGCGRTLFDLIDVTEQVKKHFGHLSRLKIGVMGCIVNGPGEMGDADYGYVGAGTGKISLYKGTVLMKKNLPSAEAIQELENLIRENGDWESSK